MAQDQKGIHLKRQSAHGYQENQEVEARVEAVHPFGVFLELPDGTPAYIRQRELTLDGQANPHDIVTRGDRVTAVVIALPKGDHKLELSIRQTQPDPWESFGVQFEARDTVVARVKSITVHGVWVEVMPGVDGFVPTRELAPWAAELV
jgi:small subunit ribosomal protein S1